MSTSGPYAPGKASKAIVAPKGSDALAQYCAPRWRSSRGLFAIMLGVAIIILALTFRLFEASDWQQNPYFGTFELLLIALVFVVSWIKTPRLPPQKD